MKTGIAGAATIVLCAFLANSAAIAQSLETPSEASRPPATGDILPDVPPGVEALSLTGTELHAGEPGEKLAEDVRAARADYDADPQDADNIIWLGRRLGYTQQYREAIRVFSEGIDEFPDDPRMYRHRGHRYISIRAFDRAIADLEYAATLIEGTEDRIEPDGAPNPAGIPVSTLHSNIRYHLALAYYLSGDLDNARRVYLRALEETPNDDMRVATTHWAYMTLRRMGRDDEAARLLEPIREDMTIHESMAYHRLCLLYKGEGELESALDAGITAAGGDAAAYGVGNWHYYNGRTDEARSVFERLLADGSWASFGYIAAEADLARHF